MLQLTVKFSTQTLILKQDQQILSIHSVSTAKNGPGEVKGSFCTPRGLHCIKAKIGASCPPYSVFVGRKSTGEIYTPELKAQYPERDWILSRILWLGGCETGVNLGGDVDTENRYIYIHGTNEEDKLGTPASHGCIRMRNDEIICLFEKVEVGAEVQIIE